MPHEPLLRAIARLLASAQIDPGTLANWLVGATLHAPLPAEDLAALTLWINADETPLALAQRALLREQLGLPHDAAAGLDAAPAQPEDPAVPAEGALEPGLLNCAEVNLDGAAVALAGTSQAWWGACDDGPLRGAMFSEFEAAHDVAVGDETFSPQDVRGLLSVLAEAHSPAAAGQDSRQAPSKDGEVLDPLRFHNSLRQWIVGDDDEEDAAEFYLQGQSQVWDYDFWKAELLSQQSLTGSARPGAGQNGAVGAGEVISYSVALHKGEIQTPETYNYWIEFDDKGQGINAAWGSDSPKVNSDRSDYSDWSGRKPTQPFVDPELVRQIYLKSILDPD